MKIAGPVHERSARDRKKAEPGRDHSEGGKKIEGCVDGWIEATENSDPATAAGSGRRGKKKTPPRRVQGGGERREPVRDRASAVRPPTLLSRREREALPGPAEADLRAFVRPLEGGGNAPDGCKTPLIG